MVHSDRIFSQLLRLRFIHIYVFVHKITKMGTQPILEPDRNHPWGTVQNQSYVNCICKSLG